MILSERTRTISALGIIQIFAWGSTFYLPAVLVGPISLDTDWSSGTLSTGVSVGLLISGLTARKIGGLIQAEGGRRVLAAGMILIAVGLTVLGLARSLPVYFAAWVLLGFGMAHLLAPMLETEMYSFPFVISDATYGISVVVVLISGLLCAALIRRRVYALDLVTVLKTRE